MCFSDALEKRASLDSKRRVNPIGSCGEAKRWWDLFDGRTDGRSASALQFYTTAVGHNNLDWADTETNCYRYASRLAIRIKS